MTGWIPPHNRSQDPTRIVEDKMVDHLIPYLAQRRKSGCGCITVCERDVSSTRDVLIGIIKPFRCICSSCRLWVDFPGRVLRPRVKLRGGRIRGGIHRSPRWLVLGFRRYLQTFGRVWPQAYREWCSARPRQFMVCRMMRVVKSQVLCHRCLSEFHLIWRHAGSRAEGWGRARRVMAPAAATATNV